MQAMIPVGYQHRIQSIVNQYNSKKPLMLAIQKMARSDFLNGREKGYHEGKKFVASLIWLFEKDAHFDKVVSGYYDKRQKADPTEEERRKQEAEQREAEKQRRREEARRIEEEEREAKRRQREYDEAHRATPEELEKIFAEFKLPPLTTDDAVKP